MAREKLNKEINIIEMVKSWRYFERAIRFLLPLKQRLDFKERSRYIAIDPDQDEEKEQQQSFRMMAKRSASIRRQDFSDGFFSSQDEESDKGAVDHHNPVSVNNLHESDSELPIDETTAGRLTPFGV